MKNIDSRLSLIKEVFTKAHDLELIRIRAKLDNSSGSTFDLNGQDMTNFICNNYLAFEMDERVKQAAIEGIQRFGLQTSVSRTYVTFDHFNELEEKLEKIFELPTIIASCTALGNLAYIPLIVGSNDAIILDQFAHESVKMAANLLKVEGRHIEVIKHNNMEILEKRIKVLRETYTNIWYLADSVYSMHGDTAPIQDIETLLNSYDNFYCYLDDAHGMSWIGKNGKGFVLNKINKHEKLYIITALNKGFGAMSSALIFPNKEIKTYVETCNAAIRFSAPTPHAGILAASKIADIHLSSEIYEKQAQLNELITHFKSRAKQLNLPIINFSHTPIFYLAVGASVDVLFKFGKYFKDSGFLMSMASYPVVPVVHSGFRISLSLYQTTKSIDNLLFTIAEYIEDLERKGQFNREDALKGFKLNIKERERMLASI
ncbi:hypothetical protein GCM10011514_11010 [Emticicia aquatilis]|uniref:Aminotransferase class I/classII large domain-containing protein n=1 Tax=Emticicia aquatilis TaxID=1537369 RepID=A0A917DLH4_9BACT|nr:aminotransferase class I/II-fold pyridoxal phosphate-dependent enzyme [Emticicia aquatilis]GGD48710.1 hypothetical protein GCM10011514_11010 [Emticicia aquatilis]